MCLIESWFGLVVQKKRKDTRSVYLCASFVTLDRAGGADVQVQCSPSTKT